MDNPSSSNHERAATFLEETAALFGFPMDQVKNLIDQARTIAGLPAFMLPGPLKELKKLEHMAVNLDPLSIVQKMTEEQLDILANHLKTRLEWVMYGDDQEQRQREITQPRPDGDAESQPTESGQPHGAGGKLPRTESSE